MGCILGHWSVKFALPFPRRRAEDDEAEAIISRNPLKSLPLLFNQE